MHWEHKPVTQEGTGKDHHKFPSLGPRKHKNKVTCPTMKKGVSEKGGKTAKYNSHKDDQKNILAHLTTNQE